MMFVHRLMKQQQKSRSLFIAIAFPRNVLHLARIHDFLFMYIFSKEFQNNQQRNEGSEGKKRELKA